MAGTNLTNDIVIQKAKAIGFDLIGFAKAEILEKESKQLLDWLNRKYQAGMDYMERNLDKRKDLKKILPNAKSVISLALNYYTEHEYSNEKDNGKISRYAWGKDYHLVIWSMLNELKGELKNIEPEFECFSNVDTGPVMDKVWAVRSGIGWLGKHTNVINRSIGSWFFIANMVTNNEFDYSENIPDFCGSCTACIDACPTNAIVEEYVLDSNKCISYLTIENKQEIPDDYKGKFENWLFGCDICQDVCPWNQKINLGSLIKEFHPEHKEIQLDEILEMKEEIFRVEFKHSAVKRAKLSGLKRNAAFLKR